MDALFTFVLAVAVGAVGVMLLSFFAGRLRLTFQGKPLVLQRPLVWVLGLYTAGHAWADTGNGLLFGAMLLCLLVWDGSPLRRRQRTRYTDSSGAE